MQGRKVQKTEWEEETKQGTKKSVKGQSIDKKEWIRSWVVY